MRGKISCSSNKASLRSCRDAEIRGFEPGSLQPFILMSVCWLIISRPIRTLLLSFLAIEVHIGPEAGCN